MTWAVWITIYGAAYFEGLAKPIMFGTAKYAKHTKDLRSSDSDLRSQRPEGLQINNTNQ